jgi:hypothetical protein
MFRRGLVVHVSRCVSIELFEIRAGFHAAEDSTWTRSPARRSAEVPFERNII